MCPSEENDSAFCIRVTLYPLPECLSPSTGQLLPVKSMKQNCCCALLSSHSGGFIRIWKDRMCSTDSNVRVCVHVCVRACVCVYRICVLSPTPCRARWLGPVASLPIRFLSSWARQRLEPIRVLIHFLRGNGDGNGAVVGIYWQLGEGGARNYSEINNFK